MQLAQVERVSHERVGLAERVSGAKAPLVGFERRTPVTQLMVGRADVQCAGGHLITESVFFGNLQRPAVTLQGFPRVTRAKLHDRRTCHNPN